MFEDGEHVHCLCSELGLGHSWTRRLGLQPACAFTRRYVLLHTQTTLSLPTLVPKGFVWIWVPKGELTLQVLLKMEEMRFYYVESLCWVKMHVNNRIIHQERKYFNNSKLVAYAFRRRDVKGKNFPIDLRHQRNSDVHTGFVRFDQGICVQRHVLCADVLFSDREGDTTRRTFVLRC